MAKFRYITFKSARREEKKAIKRAIIRAEKDFKSGKSLNDNPYKGVEQNWAWHKRFISLNNYHDNTQIEYH